MSMATLLRIIIIPSLVKSEEQEIALKQKPTNWTISDPVIGPGLGHLVERVLVLHSSGPASPISIMIVIRCTTRGLQQTFRAIAPALQASTYSSSSTWVAAGEGGKGGG